MTRRDSLALLAGAGFAPRLVADPPPYHDHASRPLAVVDGGNAKVYINSGCVTPAGTWLVSVTLGKPQGRHFVGLRRSTDRGKTWDVRTTVLDPAAPFDGEMGQLLAVPKPLGPAGVRRVYQFHIVKDTRVGVRFGRLVFTVSEDDGRTWAGPGGPNTAYEVPAPLYDLAPKGAGWHLMAPGLVLTGGDWLLPLNVSTDPKTLGDIRSEVVVLRSPNILSEADPAKLRWDFHPAPPRGVVAPRRDRPAESLAQEPQVVELSDGRLFCVMRTGVGAVYHTTSRDAGRTWQSPARPLLGADGRAVRNPNCPCPLTRLSGGRYALLHCDNDGTGHGGKDPFDHTVNRHPVSVCVGREDLRAEQPLRFGPSRLLCDIRGYKPGSKWRDLTYGFLLEDGGEVFHFYNAVWEDVLVNRVDPAKLG